MMIAPLLLQFIWAAHPSPSAANPFAEVKWERFSVTNKEWVKDKTFQPGKLYREQMNNKKTVLRYKLVYPSALCDTSELKWHGYKNVQVAATLLHLRIEGAEVIADHLINEFNLDPVKVAQARANLREEDDLIALADSQ